MSQPPAGTPRPRNLKEMRAVDVAALIGRDPRLIIPVGTCEQHGPHLPMGGDTIIVERLARDLSAEFGVLLAPTMEYGVNAETERSFAGNASLQNIISAARDSLGPDTNNHRRDFINLVQAFQRIR